MERLSIIDLTGGTDHWRVSPVWAALMFQLRHVVYLEQPAAQAPTYSWQDIY